MLNLFAKNKMYKEVGELNREIRPDGLIMKEYITVLPTVDEVYFTVEISQRIKVFWRFFTNLVTEKKIFHAQAPVLPLLHQIKRGEELDLDNYRKNAKEDLKQKYETANQAIKEATELPEGQRKDLKESIDREFNETTKGFNNIPQKDKTLLSTFDKTYSYLGKSFDSQIINTLYFAREADDAVELVEVKVANLRDKVSLIGASNIVLTKQAIADAMTYLDEKLLEKVQ